MRDLGIHFSPDLKWSSHIDIITKKARRVSYCLLKSLKSKDPGLLINLFKIYVRPILEFGSNVFNPHLNKDILAIEKIQSDFLKMVYFRSNQINTIRSEFPHISPPYHQLLTTFNLESLELRRLQSDLKLFHRFIHGLIPIKHNNSFTIQKSRTRGESFKISSQLTTTNIRFNSFFVKTSRQYSKLPPELRIKPPLEFLVHLKNFNLSYLLNTTTD